jgi:hypothetical protein
MAIHIAFLAILVLVIVAAVLVFWNRARGSREQTVIVTLKLPPNADLDRLNELEEKLSAAIEQARAGRLYGDQFTADTCTLYLQGRSAECLYRAAIPPLRDFQPPPGSYLLKRFGKPGARQQRVELTDAP